jgi:uncharacterized C2H2 Zn-finger protein
MTEEKTYPCRCGTDHSGPNGYQEFRNHECFHKKLEVIDSTVDGELVVYCPACETAWIAPCVASGLSVKMTESAWGRGCDYCRQLVMSEIKEKMPDNFEYNCPDCGEKWRIHKDAR